MILKIKRNGRWNLLQLANPEDGFATGGAGPLDGRPAVLQFDLLGILDLPVLLFLVDAVSGYHCEFLAPNSLSLIYKHYQNAPKWGFFGQAVHLPTILLSPGNVPCLDGPRFIQSRQQSPSLAWMNPLFANSS